METRHALHGVTWPVSNPKTLHVDFSTQEDFDKAKANEETDNAQVSTIPGTVEDWLREQDMKREKGELVIINIAISLLSEGISVCVSRLNILIHFKLSVLLQPLLSFK